jgi:hypothetical protein
MLVVGDKFLGVVRVTGRMVDQVCKCLPTVWCLFSHECVCCLSVRERKRKVEIAGTVYALYTVLSGQHKIDLTYQYN